MQQKQLPPEIHRAKITSVYGSPEVTNKVAVHCDTLRVSNQTGQGNWSNCRLLLSQQKWYATAKPLLVQTQAP